MNNLNPTPYLNKALIAAKREMEQPKLDKQSSAYSNHRYSSLGELLRCVTPALDKNGLEMTIYLVRDELGTPGAKIILSHESGEQRISEPCYVPADQEKNMRHSYGKSFTYAQRYLISAFFGLHQGMNETDNDGNHDDEPVKKEEKTAPKPEKKNVIQSEKTLASWKLLAVENKKIDRVAEMRRFHGICKKFGVTDPEELRAIIFKFSNGKSQSRKDLSANQYELLNNLLDNCSKEEVTKIIEAAKEKMTQTA